MKKCKKYRILFKWLPTELDYFKNETFLNLFLDQYFTWIIVAVDMVVVADAQPIAQKTTVREELGSTTSDGSDHGLSGKPHRPSF